MSDQGGDNPYESPAATLHEQSGEVGGSIDQTLQGEANLDFGDVVGEAWDRTSGVKRIFLGGILVFYIVLAILAGIGTAAIGLDSEATAASLLLQLVITIISYPFLAGVLMVGLRQSVGAHVEFGQLFQHYDRILTLAAVGIVQYILVTIGFILLIIPGLYLSFATSLAIPLHVEKNLGIIDSIMTSIKIVNKKFFTVALLQIAAGVAVLLGIITIIGWIWAIPLAIMIVAVIYRQLAGVDFEEVA